MSQSKSSKTNLPKEAVPESLNSNSSDTPSTITVTYSSINCAAQGWQCPICRNVWAPTVAGCQRCNVVAIPFVPTSPYFPMPYYPPANPLYDPGQTWFTVTCDDKISIQ